MYMLALLGIFFVSCTLLPMQEPAKDVAKKVVVTEKAAKKKHLKDAPGSSDDSSDSSSETSNGFEDSSGDAYEVAVLCETHESVDIGTDNDVVPATASWARMQKYLADRKALEESSRVTPEVVVPVISVQTNSTIAVSPTAELFLKGEDVLKPYAKNPYGPAPLRALERLAQGLDVQPAVYGGQAISHYKHKKAELENYQQTRNFEVAKTIEGHQKNLDQFISVQNVFDSNHSLECTIVDLSQKKALWSQKNQEAIVQKNNLVARIYSLGGVGDDDAALVLQDLAKSELELAKINDALFVAHASLKANQVTLTKMYDQQLGGIEKALESCDGENLQVTLIGYKNILTGHAQFRVGLLGRIKAYQSALREDMQKSQSRLYSINPFAESRDELNTRISLAQRDLRAAHAALAQLEYEDAHITPVIIKNIEEQIVNKRTVAALEDCAHNDTQFHKALEDMRISGDSSFTQSYSLNQNAKTQLEQLGVDPHKDIVLEYTGNRVQHYIQHKLIESLNAMGSIQLTEHTKPLLNFAVTCNIQGQVFNRENKVAQALYAWQASDSIVEYAATVADYVVAAGEGALEGLQSTAFTIAHVGRTSLDIVVSPEVYAPIMREKFNKAVLLVSKFVNALNEDIALLAQGDDASLIKLSQRNINRDKAMRDFAQGLATQWHSMSRRDRVKALSKFFTEWECFGAVGRVFGEYFELAKIAEAAEAAGNAVQKNPHQALIAEVVNTTAEVFDKDPAVVGKVLEFAQADADFLGKVEELNSSISREIGNFFSETQDGYLIAESVSKTLAKPYGEVVELFSNIHPKVISLEHLEFAIRRFNMVPGFTGHKDAVLERLLKIGDSRFITKDIKKTINVMTSAQGTAFELEVAIKLEEAGLQVTEFGAKYYEKGVLPRRGVHALDFDLATVDTLIECKNGNLYHDAVDPKRLKDLVESFLQHKKTAEDVAGKKYLLALGKSLPEQLKESLKINNIEYIEFIKNP